MKWRVIWRQNTESMFDFTPFQVSIKVISNFCKKIIPRCGVPYSCCHVDEDSIVPLNLMCGFEVQSTLKEKRENKAKDITEVMAKINTRGCIETIQVKF